MLTAVLYGLAAASALVVILTVGDRIARGHADARGVYEVGPSGFALARALEAAGVACVVAVPGKIERPAQARAPPTEQAAALP